MNAHATVQSADTSPVEIERALIGICLSEPSAFSACAGVIEPEHFSEAWHQSIWNCMLQLVGAGSVANALTVGAKFQNPEVAPSLKLSVYLAQCVSQTYCPAPYATDFAKQVRSAWGARELLSAVEMAKAETLSPGSDPKAVIGELMQRLDETRLQMDPRRSGFRSAAYVTTSVVDRMASAYAGTLTNRAVRTGLKDLDHKLGGGLHRGNLIIVAGRPGMGKSLVSVSLSRQAANLGEPGGFYSLEMTAEQIGARFLSDHAYRDQAVLSSGQILNGNLREADAERICEAAKDFAELPLHIDDTSSMSVGEISARTRSLADQCARKGKKLSHIWIDYLKFVKASERYRGQRHYEVGEISAGLKSLAKDIDCAVVLLAQLNRQVESREDKRPQLSDLRESGDLEADADDVIFLYREAYYLERSEPRPGSDEHLKWQTEMATAHNKIEFIIAKQRMGPTGKIEAFCNAAASAVRDAAPDYDLPSYLGDSR